MKFHSASFVVAVLFAALTLNIQPVALGQNNATSPITVIPSADTFGTGANQFTIPFVSIGLTNVPADTNGLGAVPYEYRVGTYEISQNAIDKATASGMVNVAAGAWTGNQPAANISWYEAAAFVNWLNTSTGNTAAYNLTFGWSQEMNENVWSMALWPSDQAWTAGGTNLYRNKDAAYFLPSVDEWYKAAYLGIVWQEYLYPQGYYPNYFEYPTGSDAPPEPVASGTNAGTAVYDQPQSGHNAVTNPANVDIAGGLSQFGTMGQGGNVWELLESAVQDDNISPSENRVNLGGSWFDDKNPLSSANADQGGTVGAPGSDPGMPPELGFPDTGFRVASVPEPTPEPTPTDTDNDGVNDYREDKDGTDPNDANSLNPLSKGLVAYYPLDGNANDESGYGNSGTIEGTVTPTFDRFSSSSKAYNFQGAGFISVPHNNLSSISDTNALTVSVWIYRNDDGPSGHVLGKRFPDEFTYNWQIHFESRVPWTFDFPEGTSFVSGTGYLTNVGCRLGINPASGKWLQLVGIYDRTNWTLYQNGGIVAVGTGSPYPDASAPLQLGASGGFTPFNGRIDDVRIYNRAFSSAEVAQLYLTELGCVDADENGLPDSADFIKLFSDQEFQRGQSTVLSNPSAFSLFTQAQLNSNRTAGQQDVISNPMSYGLYTTDSIMDLRMGGLMIQKQGTDAMVVFQPQTTTDLATQPFTNNGTPITNTIPMPGDKGFLRIQAR